MEPRMRPRPKGAQFPTEDLEAMLLAFGDDPSPLPETVRALDDIITDFIIETCHEADAHARHASRAKIKVDDFQFCLRHDSKKLGRVQELLDMDREIKAKRKAFNVDEGKITKEVSADGLAVAGTGAGTGTGTGTGKRRKNNNAGSEVDKDKKGADTAGAGAGAAAVGSEMAGEQDAFPRGGDGDVGIKREDSGSAG